MWEEVRSFCHVLKGELVTAGVPSVRAQKLLGHRNIAMTQRYAHHYPESLRSSVEALDAWYKSAALREQCN